MSKRKKRLRKIFQNPKTVSFKELDSILKGFKFEVRQPKSGSSHFILSGKTPAKNFKFGRGIKAESSENQTSEDFSPRKFIYTKGEIQISVPFKRPYVKEVYVKRVLELIGGENNEERS